METLPPTCRSSLPFPLLLTILPGPTRKRTETLYHYRVTYRSPDPEAAGCVMTWEVRGGRVAYQIAVERAGNGQHHWHCTCADHVFRAEGEGRFCKHVEGLLGFLQPGYPCPRDVHKAAGLERTSKVA